MRAGNFVGASTDLVDFSGSSLLTAPLGIKPGHGWVLPIAPATSCCADGAPMAVGLQLHLGSGLTVYAALNVYANSCAK
jgi:hypothetical protein